MKGYKLLALACIVALSIAAVFGLASCKDDGAEYTLYAPDGAPALAAAGIIGGFTHGDTAIKANVVGSDKIQQYAADADLAIVPSNLAANLFNKGSDIKVIATVTHGNLYFIGSSDAAAVTKASDLEGKVVFSIGQGSVPALIFERLLADNGIAYEISTDTAAAQPAAGKVTLCYAADGAAAIRAVKSKDSADYYGIVGEPAVSIAAVKNGLEDKGSLQTLCGGGYSQAVLIAKTSVAKDGELIAALLDALKANADSIVTDEGAKAAYEAIKGNFDATSLAATIDGAIARRCNVSVTAISSESGYSEYLDTLNKVFALKAAAVGGSVPAKDSGFYYGISN
ncbi:MAG: ABC transporter substrate-binding protein [Clostridia bacterium]|nr:ABC transporter substrate-binding protein [Clostridia bacterium]